MGRQLAVEVGQQERKKRTTYTHKCLQLVHRVRQKIGIPLDNSSREKCDTSATSVSWFCEDVSGAFATPVSDVPHQNIQARPRDALRLPGEV